MNKKYLHIIYTCLATTLLAGCSLEYPDRDFLGEEGNVVFDNTTLRVPVQVAIDDIRGTFCGIEDADLYVYAFYTPTSGVKGAPEKVDYTASMDTQDDEKIFCLIDDANAGHGKKARLNSNLDALLQWQNDEVVYYNSTYSQYRYKFFAYHVGNANMGKVERDSTEIAFDVEIDGTQNLMCACASLTDKQKERIGDSPVYPYSATTGALGLFPTFKMEGQLASLHFAMSEDSAEGASIEKVVIVAPYKGQFVVAAADETKMGITFDADTKDFAQSFEEDGAMFFLPAASGYDLTIKLGDGKTFSSVLNGTFKAGETYIVEVKVNDFENIEFEVK